MKGLLVVVMLACVATEALATGCLGGCNKKPKPVSEGVDFLGLEEFTSKHFVSVHPENAQLTPKAALENQNSKFLGQLKGSVGQMTGGVKKAAEVFIALAEAKQCDDNVLALLREAQLGELDPSGHSTSQTVARYVMPPVLEACTKYTHEALSRRMLSVSSGLMRFLQVVSPSQLAGSGEGRSATSDGLYKLLNVDGVTKVVRRMSKGNSDGVQLNGDIDEQTINKYLVAPCKELQETFGGLLEGAEAISSFSKSKKSAFVQFENISWTQRACDYILKKSNSSGVIALDRFYPY